MFYTESMEAIQPGDVAVKRYPFKFSALMLTFLIAGLVLAFASLGLTIWRFLGFLKEPSVYGWMQYILLFFVSLFMIALILGMLIRSQYLITGTHLVLQFGFIRQKYELKTIFSVHLFKGLNKVAVYFDDFKTKYTVIVIKEIWYDDFIKALLERRPGIGFSFSTAEEEEDFKKKK